MSKARFVFFTVMPSPYQRQTFAALSALTDEIDIQVYYYTASTTDREWKTISLSHYERVLPGGPVRRLWSSAFWNPSVRSICRQESGGIFVVSDYSAITAQYVMWWSFLKRQPFVYWGEIPGFSTGVLRAFARYLLTLPIRFSRYPIVAIGSAAEDRYRELFGCKRKYFNIPYLCDLRSFGYHALVPRLNNRILFSGQFIHRKGITILIDAIRILHQMGYDFRLIMVGGTLQRLREVCNVDDLSKVLSVRGFVQPDDLPAVFAEASIFCLPSLHDGWGIVLNEALGAGHAICASTSVHAAYDLIKSGENGVMFEAGSVPALVEALRILLDEPELVDKMRMTSIELSFAWDVSTAPDRWLKFQNSIAGCDID